MDCHSPLWSWLLTFPPPYMSQFLSVDNVVLCTFPDRNKLPSACYHSAQNLLSSSLLSKNLKIKIYRTIFLSVVLYGCETWSLTLREERRLRVFENRVLRRIFGLKRDEVTFFQDGWSSFVCIWISRLVFQRSLVSSYDFASYFV